MLEFLQFHLEITPLFPHAMARYYDVDGTIDIVRYHQFFCLAHIITEYCNLWESGYYLFSDYLDYEQLFPALHTLRFSFFSPHPPTPTQWIFTGDTLTLERRRIDYKQIVETLMSTVKSAGVQISRVTADIQQIGTLVVHLT